MQLPHQSGSAAATLSVRPVLLRLDVCSIFFVPGSFSFMKKIRAGQQVLFFWQVPASSAAAAALGPN